MNDMSSQPREILLLSRAEKALVEANTVDEAKDLRDKAAAIIIYVKKARLGQTMAAEASAVRLRAERRMGELLRSTPLARAAPGNQYTGPLDSIGTEREVRTLRELGISKSDSSRSQRIASVPSPVFEQYLKASLAEHREPTAAGLFRMARDNRPPQHDGNNKPTQPNASVAISEHTAETALFATGFLDLPASGLENPQNGPNVDRACKMPVGRHFRDQAHLHVLVTPAGLLAGLDILDAWQFTYQGILLATTTDEHGGMPWQRPHELLLVGVRGGLPLGRLRREHQGQDENEGRQTLLAAIEKMSPGPYAHILAADGQTRHGWGSIEPSGRR